MPTFDININGLGGLQGPGGKQWSITYPGGVDYHVLNSDDTGTSYASYAYQTGMNGWANFNISYTGEPFTPAYSHINSVYLIDCQYFNNWQLGHGTINVFCYDGVTVYAGDAVAQYNNVWTYADKTWATNPAGGDWTAAAINAMQWGARICVYEDGGPPITGLSYLHVVVDYSLTLPDRSIKVRGYSF